jgi:ankyrin repeat protein
VSIVNGSGAKAKIKGHLPLLAVAGDGPVAVVEALLEAKTDVNQVHATTGHTALHLAAKAGRADLLQLILDKKALVDVRDKRGRTALHFAASQGHVKCTTLLLDAVSQNTMSPLPRIFII